MGEVVIVPMPVAYLDIAERLRPTIPPIFPGCPECGPSDADRLLAFELWQALDEESKRWYLKHSRTIRSLFEKNEKSKVRPKGTAKGLRKYATKGGTNVLQQAETIGIIEE